MRRVAVTVAIAVAALAACAPEPGPSAAASPSPRPSESLAPSPSPWSAPAPPGTSLVLLASARDTDPPGGYGLAGRPDGTGLAVIDGSPTLLVVHEFDRATGAARDHGQTGGFVSAWTLDPRAPAASAGRDLIQNVVYWDYPAERWSRAPVGPQGGSQASDASLAHLCAATLTPPGSLADPASGAGYEGQLFLINEESVAGGRSFAVTLAGGAYQLPSFGLFAHESAVVAVGTGPATTAVVTEDSASAQLRVYSGTKASSGNPVERAGLVGGDLYVVAVPGVSHEATYRATFGTGEAVRFALSAPQDQRATGADQDAAAASAGLTFIRIEDVAFDPTHPNDAYFTTTEGGAGARDPSLPGSARDGGGLWRLRFDDVAQPELGGTLTLLLDGTEWPYLDGPDNVAIDADGNLLIQEDPTSPSHYRRIVAYRIGDGAVGVVTHVPYDPSDRVDAGGGSRPERAYESSGIVDASAVYGAGWFLFTVMIHDDATLAQAIGEERAAAAVEGGYLYALHVSDWDDVYASAP